MTVQDLKEKLNLKSLCECEKGLSKEVLSGFACDLHSYVLANAPEQCAWLTILGDINSIAVCIYKNLSVIILTSDAQLDDDAKIKAIEYSVPVLTSDKSTFELSAQIYELLKQTD